MRAELGAWKCERLTGVTLQSRIIVTLLALTLVASGCASQAKFALAPNLYCIADDTPFADVPAPLQGTSVDIIYATDREMVALEDDEFGYSSLRARRVAFGRCSVSFGPPTMTWQELVQNSQSPTREHAISMVLSLVTEFGQYAPLRGMVEIDGAWVESPDEIAERDRARNQLHELLRAQLELTPRKEVFLYVHGYHNTFQNSAFRAAQIWHYVGRVGVPVMFSWPAGSSGLLQGYTRDRESGEFANPHLKRFLSDIASCPEVQKIHLICHSRGTDILGTAVRELHNECRVAGRNTREELKLGQWVLAAPDIDLDVFMERFGNDRVGFAAEQVTIYASPRDKAIGLASWLFGSMRRVGQVRLNDMHPDVATVMRHHPTVHIIDVNVKTDSTGHDYFLSSPACLSDLILVLRDGRKPGAAHGRPLFDDPNGFWQLHNDYPQFASEPE